jgi:hypothetical protein
MPRPEPGAIGAAAATGEMRTGGAGALDATRWIGSPGNMHPDPSGSPRSRPSLASRGAMLTALALLPVALALNGCATTPEQRAANERESAARDREWAADCARRGGRYISSSCVGWGGP